MPGKRRSTSRKKPRYIWTGLQVNAPTVITTGGVANVIVSEQTVENLGAVTLERIVGELRLTNDGSDAANGGVSAMGKILVAEVNDAGAMTGDHAGFDTGEDDIAKRHLWSGATFLSDRLAASPMQTKDWQIDVHGRVRLQDQKVIIVLLLDVSVTNRARFVLYVRCLLRVG